MSNESIKELVFGYRQSALLLTFAQSRLARYRAKLGLAIGLWNKKNPPPAVISEISESLIESFALDWLSQNADQCGDEWQSVDDLLVAFECLFQGISQKGKACPPANNVSHQTKPNQ